jgi:hypothetical protein
MTPRLNLLCHLGLATAHGTGTTPDALEACQREILAALGALYDLQGKTQRPTDTVARLLSEPVDGYPGKG